MIIRFFFFFNYGNKIIERHSLQLYAVLKSYKKLFKQFTRKRRTVKNTSRCACTIYIWSAVGTSDWPSYEKNNSQRSPRQRVLINRN